MLGVACYACSNTAVKILGRRMKREGKRENQMNNFCQFLNPFFLFRFMLHLVFLLHCSSLQQIRWWISHHDKDGGNEKYSQKQFKFKVSVKPRNTDSRFLIYWGSIISLNVLNCRSNILIIKIFHVGGVQRKGIEQGFFPCVCLVGFFLFLWVV